FRVPVGQVYTAVESPRGELGCHAVSDGGTRPYRAHFRDPSFTNLQALAAMAEGGMVADVIAAVAGLGPGLGGGGRGVRAAVRGGVDRGYRSAVRRGPGWTRTPPRSSAGTRGRGRRCCHCFTWSRPRRASSPTTASRSVPATSG